MRAFLLACTPLAAVLSLCAGVGCGGSQADHLLFTDHLGEAAYPSEEPFVRRPFRPYSGEHWIGNGIAYGPYRDGQYPGGPSPSKEELREDLLFMARYWHLLRMYGTVGPAETVLEIIQEEDLDMKVMLGVWIAAEERRDENGNILERLPEALGANRREIETAIRLVAAYPKIILAVCVGNETQVFWSAHRSPPDVLIGYLREVRTRTEVPVTTADDFNFWNKLESSAVAREIDFMVMHAHPLWNGIELEEALPWIQGTLAQVRAAHPNKVVVLGETGWATRKHNEGEQARLIRGRPGEREQKIFYEALTDWVKRERIPTFFFEAFDESWKGGVHPDEVEKHWGLVRADRTPKMALAGVSDP
jgi:exo-beta-1,3-glucanase (GH17 family)